MELSSKRVFRVRMHTALRFQTRRYKAGYHLLNSTADGYDGKKKGNRRTAPTTLRLGHRRKKGLFIAGIYRRFRVRIVRMRRHRWGLLLKRLKDFYLRLLKETTEIGPNLEMFVHSVPLIYPHAF